MTAEILRFTGETTLDEPVEGFLDKAKKWGLEKCILIGLDEDGKLRFGGSTSDVGLINFLMDMVKLELVSHQLESSR